MRSSQVLFGGFAGAGLLTATHETLRRVIPDAPRMDLLGMQALRFMLRKAGVEQPNRQSLFLYTMAGDLIANTIYYSLGGVNSRHVVLRSTVLGLAAGFGAVLLPGPMGLNEQHSSRTLQTKLLTVGIYTLGGLTAGLVLRMLRKKSAPHTPDARLVL